MTGEEIITGLIDRLDYHMLAKNPASIHQDPRGWTNVKLLRNT